MNNIHPLIAQIIAPLRPATKPCQKCNGPMEFYGWRTVDHPAGEAGLKRYECQNCGNIGEEIG